MNIQTKLTRGFGRRVIWITVIAVITAIGLLMSVNNLTLDRPIRADIFLRHSHQYLISSSEQQETYKVRRVTAYNVGDSSQTDRTPCIGANNENLCQALTQGKKACAANFVPLNTYLYIESFGTCRVADRLSERFGNRVDIAMPPYQKHKAMKFGVKYLAVTVLH
jgi:3D (Asp-Asp-Asp) domain-containing protein